MCHVATVFFRKPDKNKDKEGRAYEVHKLPSNELGGCVKTFIDKWLVVYRRLRGRNLDSEDHMFLRLSVEGVFKLHEDVCHRNFSQLLKKWLDLANIIPMVGESLGYCTLHCFRRGAGQNFSC